MTQFASHPAIDSTRVRASWRELRMAAGRVTLDGSPIARRSRLWATVLALPWTLALALWAARGELHTEGHTVARAVRDPRSLRDIITGIVAIEFVLLAGVSAISPARQTLAVLALVPLLPILVDLPRWIGPLARLTWSPVDSHPAPRHARMHVLVLARGAATDRELLFARIATETATRVHVANLHR